MAVLITIRGIGAGSRLLLTKPSMIVGRDPDNDVVVDDPEASRRHARIKARGKGHIIEDLDSRNGTYVNGEKVINATLSDGDRLHIGNSEYLFLTGVIDVALIHSQMTLSDEARKRLGLNRKFHFHDSPRYAPANRRRIAVSDLIPSASQAVLCHEIADNILACQDTLGDLALAVARGTSRILPTAEMVAVFRWSHSSGQLSPAASLSTRPEQEHEVIIAQSAVADIVARKSILICGPATQPAEDRPTISALIPIVNRDEVFGMVFVETTALPTALDAAIPLLWSILNKVTPAIEALFLRGEVEAWAMGAVDIILALIEAKDTYTRGHSERVNRYALAIGNELRLKQETRKLLMFSSLCHDVGKIGIPDGILKKASLLSTDEYDEMRSHPDLGSTLIGHLPGSEKFMSGVRHHHERWDGTGYPDALAGEDIPFFGRIVAIADVFDAMVSGRSYSGFMDEQTAVERLNEQADLFDPEVIKAFNRAYDSGVITLKNATFSRLAKAEDEEAG